MGTTILHFRGNKELINIEWTPETYFIIDELGT